MKLLQIKIDITEGAVLSKPMHLFTLNVHLSCVRLSHFFNLVDFNLYLVIQTYFYLLSRVLSCEDPNLK